MDENTLAKLKELDDKIHRCEQELEALEAERRAVLLPPDAALNTLHLSRKVSNALLREGITTVYEVLERLEKWGPEFFYTIRNFGAHSSRQVLKALVDQGFDWRGWMQMWLNENPL